MTAPTNKQITVFIQKSAGNQSTASSNGVASTESNSVFTVVAHLAETFDFGISAEYQQPYANIANDLVSSIPIAGKIVKTTPITSPFLSANYWQGSETQEMTLDIVIEADSDPLTEVRIPVLNLLSLVSPQYLTGTGLMISPISQITLTAEQTEEMMNMATQAVTTVGKGLASAATSIASTAKDMKADAQAGIVGAISSVTSSLNNAINGVINQGQEFLGGLAESFGDTVSNAVAGAANVIGIDLTTDSNKEISTQKAANTESQQKQESSQVAQSANANATSPTALMVSKLKNVVSIKIGTYAYFPAVVVTGVNVTFMHSIDAYTGWPLSAAVQLTFKPMFTQTVGDVEQVFQSSINTTTSESFLDNAQDPVNGTLTSAFTAPITQTIKSAANSVTEAATGLANKATSQIKSMTNSAIDSVSSMLPWD